MDTFHLPSFVFPAPIEWSQARYQQVENRQTALEAVLKELRYEGVLLLDPENFCWFTAGGDAREQGACEIPLAGLYVTSGKRVALCYDEIAAALFSEEIGSLGFQLKQRPTRASLEELFDEVCRGRRVCSDTGFGRTRSIGPRIDALRQQPSSFLERTTQELASTTTLCTEQAIGEFAHRGTTGQLAGLISRCLTTRGVRPVQVEVVADDDLARGLSRSALNSRIKKRVSVRVIARRAGVHFVLLRSLCFEPLSEQEEATYRLLQRQLAETVTRINAGHTWPETYAAIAAMQRDGNAIVDGQWSLTGWQQGYRQPERLFSYDQETEQTAEPGTLCYWELRSGPLRTGLMHVIGKNHQFQETSVWPMQQVPTTMNEPLSIPSFLRRYLQASPVEQ